LLAEQVHFICHSKKTRNQIEYEIPLLDGARTFAMTVFNIARAAFNYSAAPFWNSPQFHFGTHAEVPGSKTVAKPFVQSGIQIPTINQASGDSKMLAGPDLAGLKCSFGRETMRTKVELTFDK
jgi:hypothetical protein